jgi:hypothetical protein
VEKHVYRVWGTFDRITPSSGRPPPWAQCAVLCPGSVRLVSPGWLPGTAGGDKAHQWHASWHDGAGVKGSPPHEPRGVSGSCGTKISLCARLRPTRHNKTRDMSGSVSTCLVPHPGSMSTDAPSTSTLRRTIDVVLSFKHTFMHWPPRRVASVHQAWNEHRHDTTRSPSARVDASNNGSEEDGECRGCRGYREGRRRQLAELTHPVSYGG